MVMATSCTAGRLEIDGSARTRRIFDVDAAQAEMAALVRRQLALLGEDPEREGLQRTPERVAKSLAALTSGYATDVADVVGQGVFEEDSDQMVMVRDIEMYSLCEH